MLFCPGSVQIAKALVVIINSPTIYSIQMLTDGRIEQFWMLGCCAVTIVLGNMFNSNLKTLEIVPHIGGITATLKFIN